MVTVGIIGAGRIGKVHTRSICNFVHNAKLKTVADPFMNEETEKWLKEMGAEHTTKDYHEILNDPEIQAVLICSSTDTHSSLKYQVGFNRRFDHNFAAVKQAVVDGKVGDPHIIRITSRDPEPPSPAYVAVSGGMFLDMTIHDFDMVRFLAGCDAEEIYVQSAVLVDPGIGEAGDVDTAVITLKMANGAIAVIDNSRRAAYGYDQRAEVFGSKGMAATSNDTASSLVLSTADGITGEKPLYFFLERYTESFAKEITCFIDSIENDTPTLVGAEDGLKPVLMGIAAKKSVEEHRPVKLSEIVY